MVSFTKSSFVALVVAALSFTGTVNAAPVADAHNPPPQGTIPVGINMIGAANARYRFVVPNDGRYTATYNPLSVSHIQITTAGGPCYFYGIDGARVRVAGASSGIVDVGPPQTIVGAQCGINF